MDPDINTAIAEAMAEQERLEAAVAGQRRERAALQATIDALPSASAQPGRRKGTSSGIRHRGRGLSRRQMLHWAGGGLATGAVIAGISANSKSLVGSNRARARSGAELLGMLTPARLDAKTSTPSILVPPPTGTASSRYPQHPGGAAKGQGRDGRGAAVQPDDGLCHRPGATNHPGCPAHRNGGVDSVGYRHDPHAPTGGRGVAAVHCRIGELSRRTLRSLLPGEVSAVQRRLQQRRAAGHHRRGDRSGPHRI